jgi:hypothetical protein
VWGPQTLELTDRRSIFFLIDIGYNQFFLLFHY